MADQVVATFSDVSDGHGELTVTAAFQGFSGCSAAYFNTRELLDFAESLRAIPLPDDILEIAGGYWERKGASAEIDQEHVRISVGKVGGRGQIGVSIHLQTEWGDGDDRENVRDVRLRLLTTYSRLDQFSKDLSSLVTGAISEAVLGAEVL